MIYLGEIHDRYDHHRNQLAVIRGLRERGVELAIGMEFFQEPFQPYLDAYLAGRLDEKEMLRKTEYFSRWRFDFRFYRDILDYVRMQGIPLIALNAPTEMVDAVSRDGIAGLSADYRARLPARIAPADKAYEDRLRTAFRLHGDLPEERFQRFMEVQSVWDEYMARRAADYLARTGAVAFIHRFGSSLNPHTHFHVVVIDGIFEADPQQNSRFIEVEELDADDAEAVQTQVRRRILRAFVRRGLLEKADRKEMEEWDHGGGFSLDAGVRIEAHDRQGLERLLRYCARPPQRLRPAEGDRRPADDLPPAQARSRRAIPDHPLAAGADRSHRRAGSAAPATPAPLLRSSRPQLVPAPGAHRPGSCPGSD